jgi:hypothetical protein
MVINALTDGKVRRFPLFTLRLFLLTTTANSPIIYLTVIRNSHVSFKSRWEVTRGQR